MDREGCNGSHKLLRVECFFWIKCSAKHLILLDIVPYRNCMCRYYYSHIMSRGAHRVYNQGSNLMVKLKELSSHIPDADRSKESGLYRSWTHGPNPAHHLFL